MTPTITVHHLVGTQDAEGKFAASIHDEITTMSLNELHRLMTSGTTSTATKDDIRRVAKKSNWQVAALFVQDPRNPSQFHSWLGPLEGLKRIGIATGDEKSEPSSLNQGPLQ